MQQVAPAMLQDRLHVGELLDLVPRQGVDHRQVEGRLGELDLGVLAVFLHRPGEGLFGLLDEPVSAPGHSAEYLV